MYLIRFSILLAAYTAIMLNEEEDPDASRRSQQGTLVRRSPEEVIRERMAAELAEQELREHEKAAIQTRRKKEELRENAKLRCAIQVAIKKARDYLESVGWDCHDAHMLEVVTGVVEAQTIFGRVYAKSLETAEKACWTINVPRSEDTVLASDWVLYTRDIFWQSDLPKDKSGRGLPIRHYPLDVSKLSNYDLSELLEALDRLSKP